MHVPRVAPDCTCALTTLLALAALWAVTICEIITFTLCGALMYHWVGNQYMTAPAFGSLSPLYKKIAFSFAIPTIVFLGALYGSVTARFLFFRIFQDSHHRYSNTVKGWSTWVGIIVVNWVVAFVIAEVIPFFSDMLSLMCSLFGASLSLPPSLPGYSA